MSRKKNILLASTCTSLRVFRDPLNELFLGYQHPVTDTQYREVRLVHEFIPTGR